MASKSSFFRNLFGSTPRKSRKNRQKARRMFIEGLEDLRVMATFAVLNLSDSGAGSLRKAIIGATRLAVDSVPKRDE